MARHSGIKFGPGISVGSIIDCTNHTRLRDAYVLSATTERNDNLFRESFGQFCVVIAAPGLFFQHVSSILSSMRLINSGLYGPVIYRERNYTGLEEMPPIAFVKPADPYAQQREFRFSWHPLGVCAPIDIIAPNIRDLCRRVA